MPQYVVTPWRDSSELLLVRRQLYRLGESKHVDERRSAIDLIAAWKIRGLLPHAVESTALLVDAILHQNSSGHSNFSVRAVYSAAFCRFVTGFCDISSHAVGGRTMNAVARELDMPASFVELRHEATHGELPSLSRLQRNAVAALNWLWHHYWANLDAPPTITDLNSPDDDALPDAFEEELRTNLKNFLNTRIEEVRRKEDASKSLPDSSQCLSLRVTVLCKGRRECLKRLAEILVAEKMMIPSYKTAVQKMDGAFLLWDEALRKIVSHQRHFLAILVGHMSDTIIASSSLNVRLDNVREATCQWLIHIFTARNWVAWAKRGVLDELRTSLVQACIMNPNVWTHRVIRALMDDADDMFKSLWVPLYNNSLPTSKASGSSSRSEAPTDLKTPGSSQDNSGSANSSHTSRSTSPNSAAWTEHPDVANLAPKQGQPENKNSGGWRRWQGAWRPKPIGTIDL